MRSWFFILISSALILVLSGCQSTSSSQAIDSPSPQTTEIEREPETPEPPEELLKHFIPEFSNDNWRSEPITVSTIAADSPYANTISVTRFFLDDKYVDRINLTSGILFDVDRAQLTRQANIVVSLLIQNFLKELQTQHVYIVGHTDSDGSASYNLDLSLRRATSVLQAMRGHNIPVERLALVPAGEHVPVVPNTTRENKALNRRVEIYLSPWEDMPLSLLRDWECPDQVCRTVDLNILSVNRDFTVANTSRDMSNARTIRPMQHLQQERQIAAPTTTTRNVAEQQRVRSVERLQNVRTLPILNARYQVDRSDPDYRPLIERLQARGY